ncbi:endoplasmic reticulum transmembrane helix translocase-like [Sycon ciliatum]|uniref:endoplasmic reticulum transmembrane helix translocase-like n=1 Tax=Sycon ciliatum TaxID=27933 RepID=UPI0031F6C78F
MAPLSEDVECTSLCVSRPLYQHGYAGPFAVLYASWLYVWSSVLGADASVEAILIGCAVIAILQVLVALFCLWSVHFKCFCTCRTVNDVNEAKLVKVIPTPNNGYPELVPLLKEKDENDDDQLAFYFQKTKYVYNVDRKEFHDVKFPVEEFLSFYRDSMGIEDDKRLVNSERKFGLNKLDISLPKFSDLFKERATAPFFVFQVFCVGLWCLDEYWYYSLFTLFMLVVFEATLVQQQLRNLSMIRDMGAKPYQITVFRGGKWKTISSDGLVPGDLLSIGRSTGDFVVPCDVLLMRGSCIVDEAMLTGESVPQMKEPMDGVSDNPVFDINTHGRLHVIFGGTKVVQHTPPPKSSGSIRPSDNGCLGYVLRTGFHTSQGKLLRTILYSVKRVTANNLETFAFIMFLMVFAVAASSYVWVQGSADPDRNRYKLFLECTLILTSVVPPELPIELSLAVNTSLIALVKLGVFCTEPFRIPFAGKVDYCCFDKTGTLTSDELVVDGIAGMDSENISKLSPVASCEPTTQQVLASCHSLAQLEDAMVGDPLEKSVLSAIDWHLSKGDTVASRHGKKQTVRILHRFHFNSTLKRMSAIVSTQVQGTMGTSYLITVKGAAEVLRPRFAELPSHFDAVHKHFSLCGSRVLALGYKHISEPSTQQIREMKREEAESDLVFGGFLVVSCPLKPDSKAVIKSIRKSSHHVNMITGDNPLTACYVAQQLSIVTRPMLQLVEQTSSSDEKNTSWQWQGLGGEPAPADDVLPAKGISQLMDTHQLCLTGPAISHLQTLKGRRRGTLLEDILPHVSVFARVAPKQKELVITTLKDQGFTTLMCGDGTNDVGALKHANVGVALLANPVPSKSKKKVAESSVDPPQGDDGRTAAADNRPVPTRIVSRRALRGDSAAASAAPLDRNAERQKKLSELMKKVDEMDQQTVVKLGDASIASPFTSKYNSPISIEHILKQGRCTLVTTLQMFKILALNALILAYTQSVLFMDGLKFSDSQATLQGMLLAGCFLFISRSKPLNKLSPERPLPNIFNIYTILTVLLQFSVHLVSLVYLSRESRALMPEAEKVDLEKKFEPSPLNSAVYLISVTMQISTFVVNYEGRPWMESIVENRPLLYSVCISAGSVFGLASGMLPDYALWFELVEFPAEFQTQLFLTLLGDFVLAFVVDRCLKFFFGKAKLKQPK